MTATEVILSLQSSGELQKLCRTVAPPRYSDDLIQEVLLALLEKPASKIVEMHTAGYFKWYVVRMACNMYSSKHSGFHKKFRQFDYSLETKFDRHFDPTFDSKDSNYIIAAEKLLERKGTLEGIDCACETYDYETDHAEQIRIDKCNQAYDKLATGDSYPYEQKLLDLYLQVRNVSKMARDTGIPRRTLIKQLKEIKQRIKNETDGIDT